MMKLQDCKTLDELMDVYAGTPNAIPIVCLVIRAAEIGGEKVKDAACRSCEKYKVAEDIVRDSKKSLDGGLYRGYVHGVSNLKEVIRALDVKQIIEGE